MFSVSATSISSAPTSYSTSSETAGTIASAAPSIFSTETAGTIASASTPAGSTFCAIA